MAERFDEGCSGVIRGIIRDENGDMVPASQIDSATFTLFDVETRQRINGRDEQDVYGGSPSGSPDESTANDVHIYEVLQTAADGSQYNLEWLVQPEDNVIVTNRRQMERHRAFFVFTAGSTTLRVEIAIEVKNLGINTAGSP